MFFHIQVHTVFICAVSSALPRDKLIFIGILNKGELIQLSQAPGT